MDNQKYSDITTSKTQGVIDHSGLKATFQLKYNERGPGIWKLNNSILHEQNILIIIILL